MARSWPKASKGKALDELTAMANALLQGLRVEPTPQQGDAAFERHQLLAIRFHRAARLNERARDREGQAWCRYFDEHFPRGSDRAELLWEKWRVRLLRMKRQGLGLRLRTVSLMRTGR